MDQLRADVVFVLSENRAVYEHLRADDGVLLAAWRPIAELRCEFQPGSQGVVYRFVVFAGTRDAGINVCDGQETISKLHRTRFLQPTHPTIAAPPPRGRRFSPRRQPLPSGPAGRPRQHHRGTGWLCDSSEREIGGPIKYDTK